MSSSMTLTTVGISGSYPGPHSAASCYLISARGDDRTYHIVLDLGSGATGPLQRFVDHASIDAVFLSHLHPDHCLDVTALYVERVYDPRFFGTQNSLAPLDIYGPPGSAERLESAHYTPTGRAQGEASAHTLSDAFTFHDVGPGSVHKVGPLTITAHLVLHPVEAYALRIEHSDGTVVTYSGDSDACDGLTEAARGADLFVCESAFEDGRDHTRGIHLTGTRAGETARAAGAKALMLTHIPPWTNADTVLTHAREAFGGPTECATPLEQYPITRR